MQAVILMAGKGTRMAKYYEGPKQLLPVNKKPVVEYLLDSLPDDIQELIFIVGGIHEERIRDHFRAGSYRGKPIRFVVQREQLGLAHAFKTANHIVKGRWLGSVADDIFDPRGVRELLIHDLAVLAYQVPDPSSFGVLVTDGNGFLVRAVEKPKEFISDLVWTGAMVMDERFFVTNVEKSARGEFETPDVWSNMIQEEGARIKVVESSYWFPVNDKAQLEAAEKAILALGS